jgi:3-isopropylmalate/(R)-2-methylmalate dehydratase small subunit
VRGADIVQPFMLDDDVRERLLSGRDPIAVTLQYEAEIAAYERTRR